MVDTFEKTSTSGFSAVNTRLALIQKFDYKIILTKVLHRVYLLYKKLRRICLIMKKIFSVEFR